MLDLLKPYREPCFDKLEAMLAHAMLSLRATKAFSIGIGFSGCQMLGSQHNDAFAPDSLNGPSTLITETNNSGDIQGGISNGAHIFFDVGFEPPYDSGLLSATGYTDIIGATIGQKQMTSDYNGEEKELENKGEHDSSYG